MIFGRNDLISDAPIPKIDLLLCRNTLMYFNPSAQEQVLARFHFALKDHGYLCVGRSEMLIRSDGDFDPVDLEHRVYLKVPKATLRERLATIVPPGDGRPERSDVQEQMPWEAFDQAPVAQLVIDREGRSAGQRAGAGTVRRASVRLGTAHRGPQRGPPPGRPAGRDRVDLRRA